MTKAFIIAGTSSSVGKTTIATGIMKALVNRGLRVNSCKVGPDYIDCAYHKRIHGGQARNLDCWLTGEANVVEIFNRGTVGADVVVVEGVMGLFDGPKDGSPGSTADIAKLLGLPVILVVNCQSVGQSMAALVKGFIEYDPKVKIAGIILNRIGSQSHFHLIKEAIAKVTQVPVLGCLSKEEKFHIPERHLGLTPSFEQAELEQYFTALADLIESNLDLDNLLHVAQELDSRTRQKVDSDSKLVIGYAFDEAFNFYYQETLEELELRGCKLVPVSPMHDLSLPRELSGLLIGGGFPEMFLDQLTDNSTFRRELKLAIAQGLPVYAECGGYMYLCDEIINPDGKHYAMVGAIKGSSQMTTKLQSLGYTEYTLQNDTLIGTQGSRFRGHEFHYSTIEPDWPPACQVRKLRTNKSYLDGYASEGLFACYTHINWIAYPELIDSFIDKCQIYRKRSKS